MEVGLTCAPVPIGGSGGMTVWRGRDAPTPGEILGKGEAHATPILVSAWRATRVISWPRREHQSGHPNGCGSGRPAARVVERAAATGQRALQRGDHQAHGDDAARRAGRGHPPAWGRPGYG